MKLAPTLATMKWRQPASTSGATSSHDLVDAARRRAGSTGARGASSRRRVDARRRRCASARGRGSRRGRRRAGARARAPSRRPPARRAPWRRTTRLRIACASTCSRDSPSATSSVWVGEERAPTRARRRRARPRMIASRRAILVGSDLLSRAASRRAKRPVSRSMRGKCAATKSRGGFPRRAADERRRRAVARSGPS